MSGNRHDAAVEDAGGSGGAGGTGGSGGTGGTGGSGGTGGTGGVGGTGGTGGGAGSNGEVGECVEDADCKLVGDCCNCFSVPLDGELPSACPALCAIDRCTMLDVSPVCLMGRCVFDETCDSAHQPICEIVPPECGPGQQPIVRDGCFGECVDARDCRGVSDCDACAPGQACVFPGENGWGSTPHSYFQCWDVASECNGVPTCECMGNDLCSPILCSDRTDGPSDPVVDIGCFCPAC